MSAAQVTPAEKATLASGHSTVSLVRAPRAPRVFTAGGTPYASHQRGSPAVLFVSFSLAFVLVVAVVEALYD